MTPNEQHTEIAKVAPPLAITSFTIFGIQVSEWVLILTALYTLLQIILTLRRYCIDRRIGDKYPACAEDCPFAKRRKAGDD